MDIKAFGNMSIKPQEVNTTYTRLFLPAYSC